MEPNQNPALIPQFKGQPWTLFDTIVSTSYLLGDTIPAVGATTPAINLNGEMVFFSSPGRSNSNTPWYTNLDTPGILSYGMEVWQMYLMFAFPAMVPVQNKGFDYTINPGVPPTVKLMEAILNFGVIDLNLGQENQTRFPCSRFGAGGGLYMNSGAGVTNVAQNGIPEGANVLQFPEPIEMPRTQNLDVKLKIAPEARGIIGSLAAPGVGSPLSPYIYGTAPSPGGEDPEVTVSLAQLPFSLQFGLVGRRIKNTQYGQIPG